MKKYFFILVTFVSGFTQAQTIIRGVVSDENKNVQQDINVTLQEKSSSLTIAYEMTDEKGKYLLEYKGKADSIMITVSGFNVRKQVKTVVNSSQKVDFFIESESIVLNEVKIVPPKIRQMGDTLNYLVESFSDLNDRTIADVLKKMPGIIVRDDGAILYQNRPINKFYIENADLLQGRYGIATNNIDAKDVSTVQVLENHQPVKMLKNKELSEDAAINLKLKDSAKGTIIANAQVGVGAAPLLWNNELTGMYIAKKLQNITTYKGNNSGDDVTRELTSFYSNDASRMTRAGLLAIQSPATPSIREKRYLNNLANTFSFNNLQSLKNDYQLTTNVTYLNDLQRKNSYAYTEYYLAGDSLLKIEEYLNSRLRKERLTGDIQLNANKEKFYLNNLLKIEGIWDRERGDLFSQDSLFQYIKKPDYRINNTFNLLKTGENNSWNFYSFTGFSSSTHTLFIEPVLYDELFNSVSHSSKMMQDLQQINFVSNSKISIGFGKGVLKQDYALSLCIDVQNLKSELKADKSVSIADSLKNNLRQNKYELIFNPTYTYTKGRLNAVLSLPLNYTIANINNHILQGKHNEGRLYFNPYVFVYYKHKGNWTSFFKYSYKNSLGNANQLYTGYILSSYRTLSRNNGDVFKQKAHNAIASLQYKNPITTLFVTANISYFNNKFNVLNDFIYQGILMVQSTIPASASTKGVNMDLHMSREIESLNSTVFLGGNYTINRSSQITQGNLIDYDNKGFLVSPRVFTKINPSVNLQYEFKYSLMNSSIKGGDKTFAPIYTMSHNAILNLMLVKGLSINIKYENFYNNTIISGDRSMSFGDIGAKYIYKQLELMIDCTNILNSKEFVSASYNDVSRYHSSYKLRPAEILFKVRFKLK